MTHTQRIPSTQYTRIKFQSELSGKRVSIPTMSQYGQIGTNPSGGAIDIENEKMIEIHGI